MIDRKPGTFHLPIRKKLDDEAPYLTLLLGLACGEPNVHSERQSSQVAEDQDNAADRSQTNLLSWMLVFPP
ncbi:hypothetical protein AOLI_G00032600 [Acnodon oligacanthus]